MTKLLQAGSHSCRQTKISKHWRSSNFYINTKYVYDYLMYCQGIRVLYPIFLVEMTGNDFLHSHFLPFPCSQFTFLPISIPNFVTNSHSHGIPTGLFPFLPIPIPEQLFHCCDINTFWLIKDSSLTRTQFQACVCSACL